MPVVASVQESLRPGDGFDLFTGLRWAIWGLDVERSTRGSAKSAIHGVSLYQASTPTPETMGGWAALLEVQIQTRSQGVEWVE